MSKICFIENRGKTQFWAGIANVLRKRGHNIGWIVQNHAFTPRGAVAAGDVVIVIPYPKAEQLTEPAEELDILLSADRGRRHFGNGNSHYSYYAMQIERSLDAFGPDVVIGEATLFHEQIAVRVCRQRGIRFLHPSMTRYPPDRFMILEGDTQNPLGGSGDRWPHDRTLEFIRSVSTGKTIPSYMRKLDRMRKLRATKDAAFGWAARLAGERYNTPSFSRKMILSHLLRKRIAQWTAMARPIASNELALLYPLQMQPEANLDVWGHPFSEQVVTLREMLRATPRHVSVAVKANPKAKYELTDELIELASCESRLVLLPLNFSMADAQAQTLGTLTVTGTVAFEAVLGKGRCIALRHPVLKSEFPNFHADSIADGVARLIEQPEAGIGNEASATKLMDYFVRVSYPGIVNEPLFDRRAVDPQNLELVASAIASEIEA
ncbi:hypothetical protein [Qipengyuania gaetbuli]|uniref:hypothetical protein n=1 Tax=Qipengyuania gaetbuli TaxID=266952 RepID=UPI001CFE8765|nr:hypothetical protein [Qipengyuania gaetbuli]